MSKLLNRCAAVLALAAGAACAAPTTFYDNTTTDLQNSVFFSTGFSRIGDQLQLASAGALGGLSTQFYNAGDDAVFNATLNFFSTGANPTQLGGNYTVSGIAIAAGSSLTVTFSDLGGLDVPAELIVALSVELVSGQGDIGLNLFDAPSVGSSDDGFFVADSGQGLASATTLMNMDNLYLLLSGAPDATVAEPGTAALVLLPLAGLGLARRRRQGHIDRVRV